MRKKANKIGKIKSKIVGVLEGAGVVRAGVFGSYARGEEKRNSDIDILVEFDGSLLDLVGLEMELKKVLGVKVDLLTYGGISPYLEDRILGEEIRII